MLKEGRSLSQGHSGGWLLNAVLASLLENAEENVQ